jgi:hypothetical protein
LDVFSLFPETPRGEVPYKGKCTSIDTELPKEMLAQEVFISHVDTNPNCSFIMKFEAPSSAGLYRK